MIELVRAKLSTSENRRKIDDLIYMKVVEVISEISSKKAAHIRISELNKEIRSRNLEKTSRSPSAAFILNSPFKLS